jgi:hypothetical protein
MGVDRKSGKRRAKPMAHRGAGVSKKAAPKKLAAKKSTAKKAAQKKAAPRRKPAAERAVAKKPAVKKPAAKSPAIRKASAKTRVAPPVFKTAAKPSTKRSQLPPLPPPLVPPKKASRSPARRAVGIATSAQRSAASPASIEFVSESELREKMRLASTYIETWLNRRIVFAAEVTAPEDAWAQVWLWLKQAAALEDGRILTQDLFEALYADEMTQAR